MSACKRCAAQPGEIHKAECYAVTLANRALVAEQGDNELARLRAWVAEASKLLDEHEYSGWDEDGFQWVCALCCVPEGKPHAESCEWARVARSMPDMINKQKEHRA